MHHVTIKFASLRIVEARRDCSYIYNNNPLEKVRRRFWYFPIKSQFSRDKLVRLNVNKIPSRKRHKSYELRLDGVPDTYARTVSVINDYNVQRTPFVVPLAYS